MALNIAGCLLLIILLFDKWLFLLVMGLFTSAVYMFDKYAACRNWRRVPEASLILLALLGGAIFALFTMMMINHKTRKMKFFLPVMLIAVIQMIVLIYWS